MRVALFLSSVLLCGACNSPTYSCDDRGNTNTAVAARGLTDTCRDVYSKAADPLCDVTNGEKTVESCSHTGSIGGCHFSTGNGEAETIWYYPPAYPSPSDAIPLSKCTGCTAAGADCPKGVEWLKP